MKRQECQRCGLEVAGEHASPEECLRHLAPRYALAQRSLQNLHKRYRALEERLQRSRIQERIARKEAGKNKTIAGRLERLERMLEIA